MIFQKYEILYPKTMLNPRSRFITIRARVRYPIKMNGSQEWLIMLHVRPPDSHREHNNEGKGKPTPDNSVKTPEMRPA
jgi:hypothetical protein